MSSMLRTSILTVAAVGLSATIAVAASPTEPSVTVFDQAASGTNIEVSYAYLPAKGYVAIYGSSADGKPSGAPLGVKELPAGDHRNVKVTLSATPKPGARMWVSIYKDADNKPGFDAKGDASVWAAGLPAENGFLVR